MGLGVIGLWGRSAGDIGSARVHWSIVAYGSQSARIVVEIDTQQLPPAVTRHTNNCAWAGPGHVTISARGRDVGPDFRGEGRQIFADELGRFADRDGRSDIAQISSHLTQPLKVAVCGRRGVGVRTFAQALAARGVAVIGGMVEGDADVAILVVAEVAKPEDLAALADLGAAGTPVLMVLNKADLAGSGPGGPVATAHRRAAELHKRAGVPVVPMVGLLAEAAPTARDIEALRVLAREPADLSTPDAFVSGPHRLPAAARAELLATLDRFGVAHAALEVSRGADAAMLRARLRALSETDRVLATLESVAAPVRYRRVRRALAELRGMGDEQVGRFLAADDTVVGVMAAAVDVVQAAGLWVDPGCDASAHLRRARRWHGYSRGPVSALHRSCGADIARGSLRLWGQVSR